MLIPDCGSGTVLTGSAEAGPISAGASSASGAISAPTPREPSSRVPRERRGLSEREEERCGLRAGSGRADRRP